MAYTDEEHIQRLIALLKAHGVRRVVASPGSSNVPLMASIQGDRFFEILSEVDERNAAYIACGLAAETGEPVVLSCTGATASRNYLPGITEAHYRHLPVLAITASLHTGNIGQLRPQMMDRRIQPQDSYCRSVQIAPIATADDRWAVDHAVNEAILSLTLNGGGPAHINMVSSYSTCFECKELPRVRAISRVEEVASLPRLPKGRIAVFVGEHAPWNERLQEAVDAFCEKFGAAVVHDHTSNYHGKFGVPCALLSGQDRYRSPYLEPDLVIHFGGISGAYYKLSPSEVWRINASGEPEDFFRRLALVAKMSEAELFEHYVESEPPRPEASYRTQLAADEALTRVEIPELPFSNLWCAQQASPIVPKGSVIHFGILNSLRSWNYFRLQEGIDCYSNVGGFGIEGALSSALGGAVAQPARIHFCVLGDLAFFYNVNQLGSREMPANLRIMLINNGRGIEFRNYSNIAAQFDDEADKFIAAAGHFGCQSPDLVRQYASSLGVEYLTASSKEEFLDVSPAFFSPEAREAPVLLEVFTEYHDESDALEAINGVRSSLKGAATQAAKELLGSKGKQLAKRVLGR